MNRYRYVSALKNAQHRSSLWILSFLSMLVLNGLLTVTLLIIDKNQQIIIIPPHLDKSFIVQGDKASSDYIEQMTRYLSQMLLTYHRSNAESQFNTVMNYVDPKYYGPIYNKYKKDLERIKKNKISSTFHIMKMNIYGNNALIEGEVTIVIDEKIVSKKMKAYEMNFSYANRQFYMSKFQEVFQDNSTPTLDNDFLAKEDIISIEAETKS